MRHRTCTIISQKPGVRRFSVGKKPVPLSTPPCSVLPFFSPVIILIGRVCPPFFYSCRQSHVQSAVGRLGKYGFSQSPYHSPYARFFTQPTTTSPHRVVVDHERLDEDDNTPSTPRRSLQSSPNRRRRGFGGSPASFTIETGPQLEENDVNENDVEENSVVVGGPETRCPTPCCIGGTHGAQLDVYDVV